MKVEKYNERTERELIVMSKTIIISSDAIGFDRIELHITEEKDGTFSFITYGIDTIGGLAIIKPKSGNSFNVSIEE